MLQENDTIDYSEAIALKKHTEDRRDDINKYYISLFAIIVSVMPFIGQAHKVINLIFFEQRNINLLIVMLSIIGLSLSCSWIKVLQEIRDQLAAIESFLQVREESNNNRLFTYISKYLNKEKLGSKVTRYELLVPYSFIIIFIVILVLSLFNHEIVIK